MRPANGEDPTSRKVKSRRWPAITYPTAMLNTIRLSTVRIHREHPDPNSFPRTARRQLGLFRRVRFGGRTENT